MPCQICASENLSTIGTAQEWLEVARRSGRAPRDLSGALARAGRLQDFAFVKCADCGFRFVSPCPDAAYLGEFYRRYPGTEQYGAKRDKKIKRALRRIRRLKRFAPGRRFLDVGCNLGYAVEAARLEGFSATGIDLDARAVSSARAQFPEAAFYVSDVESLRASGATFDFVYCCEVIEHLPEVRPFAGSLAGLLGPGGLLFLTTPDAGHVRVPRAFLTWDAVKPPEHLCWFTKCSLRTLFEDVGFRPLRFSFNLKPGIKMLARKRLQHAPDRGGA